MTLSLTINPLTAVFAAPSLGKTANRSATFEMIKAFPHSSHEHVKGLLPKCTVLKAELL